MWNDTLTQWRRIDDESLQNQIKVQVALTLEENSTIIMATIDLTI